LAVRRQEMASFLTSSSVGSRCVLYLARGCQRSYCACRFLPAMQTRAQPGARPWMCGNGGGSACSQGRSHFTAARGARTPALHPAGTQAAIVGLATSWHDDACTPVAARQWRVLECPRVECVTRAASRACLSLCRGPCQRAWCPSCVTSPCAQTVRKRPRRQRTDASGQVRGCTNCFQRLGWLHGERVDPALQARAGRDHKHVRRVHADVEAQHQRDRRGLQPLLLAPLGHQALRLRWRLLLLQPRLMPHLGSTCRPSHSVVNAQAGHSCRKVLLLSKVLLLRPAH